MSIRQVPRLAQEPPSLTIPPRTLNPVSFLIGGVKMLKISLDKIQSLFAKIAENAKLYLPIDNSDGSATYSEWAEGVEWSNALNTTKSPKDFFFPQTEDLMRFKTEGKNTQ